MSRENNAIDENKFRQSLSEKFIKLIDSERGMQSILAEKIGKRPSFIGEVKRGKPVNALHLKAVELHFGPAKVLELLSLDEKNAHIENIVEVLPLTDLVKPFQQKELAKKLISNSLRLEQVKPSALNEINDYINFKIQSIETSASGETPVEDARIKRANGE